MAINPINISSSSLISNLDMEGDKKVRHTSPQDVEQQTVSSESSLSSIKAVNPIDSSDIDDPLNSSLLEQKSEQERIKQIEMALQSANRSLRFHQDDESGKQIATIVDNKTGEVIRQVPAQELLDLNKNLTKYGLSSLSHKV
ncbi:flagellar protein FlaG [Photobacterium leiognathi]|uniref:flagellar protein FlaG n=1 Tax=Photobacterium leiognathi TaxID=553611 RepID=UPI002735678F|nr:flagellar protein FlaG [Photobacterium leiognathi]